MGTTSLKDGISHLKCLRVCSGTHSLRSPAPMAGCNPWRLFSSADLGTLQANCTAALQRKWGVGHLSLRGEEIMQRLVHKTCM